MGQAKARGTREQRIEAAMQRETRPRVPESAHLNGIVTYALLSVAASTWIPKKRRLK